MMAVTAMRALKMRVVNCIFEVVYGAWWRCAEVDWVSWCCAVRIDRGEQAGLYRKSEKLTAKIVTWLTDITMKDNIPSQQIGLLGFNWSDPPIMRDVVWTGDACTVNWNLQLYPLSHRRTKTANSHPKTNTLTGRRLRSFRIHRVEMLITYRLRSWPVDHMKGTAELLVYFLAFIVCDRPSKWRREFAVAIQGIFRKDFHSKRNVHRLTRSSRK